MKKNTIIIAVILTLFLVSGLAIQIRHYYDNTYASVTAYTRAPEKIPSKAQTRDDSGKVIEGSYSYQYHFKFVTKDGTTKEIEFELSGENIKPFKANQLLKAEISNIRVVNGPNEVKISDVPKTVLEKLPKNNPSN
ncbi:YxeA family protein [Leuconostoc citreum]|uniref:YxeA family protein n=1 Tax=Leuconostoc citreum TaxID=33964 RepID=UPI000BFEEACE|nr:YxeA family protein [Leuconostoc citreum]UVW17301.1 YxeA family protein [Leuconostoc citreum]